MTLREYFNTVNKNRCPPDCEFKSKENIEPALVPPPSNEIFGILISRDPTVRWLDKYRDIMGAEEEESIVRTKLFKTAIPDLLKNRIKKFMGEEIDENDKKLLFDIIFQKVYWTHLHKCFTDASGKEPSKFKIGNANKCADHWLKEELNFTIGNKTKFLIALGREVQSWVRKWKENEGRDKNIRIIDLLHPSGQNNRIWHRSALEEIKKTEEAIKALIE